MNQVKIDPTAAAALQSAGTEAELVGDDGTPLGLFVPARMADEIRRAVEARRRRYEEAFAAFPPAGPLTPEQKATAIPHEEAMKQWGLE